MVAQLSGRHTLRAAGTDESQSQKASIQPVREKVIRASAGDDTFIIPAGASRHRVEGALTPGGEVKLLSLRPHIHLRGRSMLTGIVYVAGDPKQERKIR